MRVWNIYIDPGTGSMIFTLLLGVTTTLVFFAQQWKVRLTQRIRGGRPETASSERIPYVIFSDDKRYWNVFEPSCAQFEKHQIPLTYWTCSEDDPALSGEYKYIHAEYIGGINRAAARLNTMHAGTCISTTPGLDVFQWKRSAATDRYVHVLHSAWDITSYRMFGIDHYDAIIVNGHFLTKQVRALEAVRHQPPKDVAELGLTYMDAMEERLRAMPQDTVKDGKKTVLLAPSWGPSSILSRYGEEMIEALLATGYRVVIRPHPQSASSEKELLDRLMTKYPDSDRLQWNFDTDNFEALRQSDIMISDFSGVALDYTLVFDKPLIYADTSFDKAPYDAAWLDEPMWIFETLPKIGRQLQREMLPDLQRILDESIADETMYRAREEVRREAWCCRGESAQKIYAYLTGEGTDA